MTQRSIIFSSAVVGAMLTLTVTGFIVIPKIRQRNKLNRLVTEVESTRGQALPAHHLSDLDGREIPAETLRHGRVLLIFLSTSCEACTEQAGLISQLYKDAPSDLRIYGVGFERSAQLAAFAKEFDLKFPLLIDRESLLRKALNIHVFPCNYLIEDGTITRAWPGTLPSLSDLQNKIGIKEGR